MNTRHLHVSACPASPTGTASVRLRPLPSGEVHITGGLWQERAEVNRRISIPNGLARLHEAGNIQNFNIAAGTADGEARGEIFADSDVYKWLEAAAWEFGRCGGEELLEQQLEVTAIVARAQAEDGYLNAVMQARGHPRYNDLTWSHEHYCAGHLIQAAVAQSRATGKRNLLDVAIKLADHLVRTFGVDKTEEIDGHPVIEMALVELYRETGTLAYLTLAQYFVRARGHGIIAAHGKEPTFFSDRVSVVDAATVEGHAVRALYLAAGAADVAAEAEDTVLLSSLERQYESMEHSKQYITGGLGSRWEGESFGDPYELPPDRAYAETCAAIGGMQWAWRMLLATAQARYADQMERILFNGFLSGVSLAGTEYFYVNPLQLRAEAHADDYRSPAHGRRGWFDTACCPPNVMRTLASLSSYFVTTASDPRQHGMGTVQIHQYAAGTIRAAGLKLDVDTAYPWQERIQIRVREAPLTPVTIAFRIPTWARGATLDGAQVNAGSYATTTVIAGQVVILELPLRPRFTTADHRVDAVRGCVALERGPIVYAFEQGDQPVDVSIADLCLDPASLVSLEHRPDLLGGVTLLRLTGSQSINREGDHRSPYASSQKAVDITAIPYFTWANRGPRPMKVWVPVHTPRRA